MTPQRLVVSVVVFDPDTPLLQRTLVSLSDAIERAKHDRALAWCAVYLVDNGAVAPVLSTDTLSQHCAAADQVRLIHGHGNIGYGNGHNRALRVSDGDFHLVLNADVALAPEALCEGVRFMAEHQQAGLLAPSVVDGTGRRQHLCKRYPSVADLALRGFAPAPIKRWFRARLSHYEMRDLIDDRVVWDIPIVSGCFILARRSVLLEVGGFAPEYFLYFEDFDLSLRVTRQARARTVYVPAVRITHFGGYASRKGWRHIGLFAASGYTFFNRHGWKWR